MYSPPPSVRNRFTCLPESFFLRAFHSLNFTRASDLYFNMYSSVCLEESLMKSTIYRPPPMGFSMGPHMSECTSYSGSVAREVLFGVKCFRAHLHLMRLSQLHFPVIFGASVIVGKISNSLRPTCARWRCHNIRFSASCRDACPVVLSASRPLLLLSILVYSVYSGAQSTTRSRIYCPST